jgi:hypothetical protein
MRLIIIVLVTVAILAGGCASWKKDAMKEPKSSYDPSTGETHYKKEPMTIFSTGDDDDDDDLLPRFEDMDSRGSPR